jgi:hypothetical protein
MEEVFAAIALVELFTVYSDSVPISRCTLFVEEVINSGLDLPLLVVQYLPSC